MNKEEEKLDQKKLVLKNDDPEAPKKKTSGLNLLISSYNDDEEEEEKIEKKKIEIVKSVKSKESDFSDDSGSDDSDIEIVTTSELKFGGSEKRNYLVPSLKASYFPLQASIATSKGRPSSYQGTLLNARLEKVDRFKDFLYK